MVGALLLAAKNAFLHYPFWVMLGLFVLIMGLWMHVSLLFESAQGRVREHLFLYVFYFAVGLMVFLTLVYTHETGKLLWG